MHTVDKIVYLDNAATTPVAPEALDVMVQALSGACGNPSSHYSVGYEAHELMDTARGQMAAALNCQPGEIFFTGGGSEADNWAIKGTANKLAKKGKKHLITSQFEHHAVLHSMKALEREGFEVTYLPITPEGFVQGFVGNIVGALGQTVFSENLWIFIVPHRKSSDSFSDGFIVIYKYRKYHIQLKKSQKFSKKDAASKCETASFLSTF